MNIFGIGGFELVLIIVIMLVVAGPQRMIRWSYIVGRYMGQFRLMWTQTARALQKELDDAGAGIQIPTDADPRKINNWMISSTSQFTRPFQESLREAKQDLDAAANPLSSKPAAATEAKPTQPAAPPREATPPGPPPRVTDFGAWGGKPVERPANAAPPSATPDLGAWGKASEAKSDDSSSAAGGR